VQEADAALGVQLTGAAGGGLGPLVTHLVALLIGLAVRQDVRPPQGVDDEQTEDQPRRDEEFTEDADGEGQRTDPSAAPPGIGGGRVVAPFGAVVVLCRVVRGRCHCSSAL